MNECQKHIYDVQLNNSDKLWWVCTLGKNNSHIPIKGYKQRVSAINKMNALIKEEKMGKRLIDTLPLLTREDLSNIREDCKIWTTVMVAADSEHVSIQTILNRVRRKELKGSNFEGRIFVLI